VDGIAGSTLEVGTLLVLVGGVGDARDVDDRPARSIAMPPLVPDRDDLDDLVLGDVDDPDVLEAPASRQGPVEAAVGCAAPPVGSCRPPRACRPSQQPSVAQQALGAAHSACRVAQGRGGRGDCHGDHSGGGTPDDDLLAHHSTVRCRAQPALSNRVNRRVRRPSQARQVSESGRQC